MNPACYRGRGDPGGALRQANDEVANGNLNQAYAMYRKILDSDSNNAEALRGVVLCLLDTGHGRTAIEAAKRLQGLKQTDAEANLLLAEVMLAGGQAPPPECLQAAGSNPRLRSRLMMAQAKVALVEEDFKKALSLALEAVRMETNEGGDVKAMLVLAEVRIQFADYEAALRALSSAEQALRKEQRALARPLLAQAHSLAAKTQERCEPRSCFCRICSKDASSGQSSPTISVGLNLDIPVNDLLSALLSYQQSLAPESNMPTPKFKGMQKPLEPPKPPIVQEAPPPVERAVEASAPGPGALTWEPCPPALRRRVKVYNLMKSVRPRDVKFIFEKHVGPVEGDCSIQDCVSTVQFMNAEHAQLAIEKYNGGILEVSSDKRKPEDEQISLQAAPWGADGPELQRRMQELLWPLEDSQLRQVETNATGNAVQPMCGFARRGDGWLTLFRVSKAKEAKRTEQQESHQVDFKGGILTVKLDDTVPDKEGIVIQGGPMVL
eukprot:symbB.v1.2.005843.t1/scaffold343.1/size224757/20